MKPFHGITEEALVDYLTTATDSKDYLTTHDYYDAEAQAVLRLLRVVDSFGYCDLSADIEKLHKLALKSARKYAKSLRRRTP